MVLVKRVTVVLNMDGVERAVTIVKKVKDANLNLVNAIESE